jgi:MFS family permease
MSSILRPTPAQRTRRTLVLGLAIFAIAIGQLQMFLGWGQSPAEFSADSDATLRVAGWAFAIWGLIYAGVAVYAIRQVLPQTGESELITAFGWPSALAFAAIGAWVLAAAFDWEVATIVLIFAALIVLLIPLLTQSGRIRALRLTDRDRLTVVWPLSLLAGWLTIASPVNLLTVATGNGDLPSGISPTMLAIAAVAVVGLIGLAVTWRIRTIAYVLPICWGLVGVFAAEEARNPTLAFTAAIVSGAVLIGAVLLVLAHRRRIERV